MSDLPTENTAKLSARRRLLRGSFAAPAVLTVCSGSTFAQAATSLTCVAKQVNTVKDTTNSATTTTASTGNWVRVPLYKLTNGGSTVDSIWIDGGYISSNVWKSGTSTFLTSGQYQCYSKVRTGSPYTAGQILTSQPSTMGFTSFSTNGEWVAVLVNASGDITGVVGLGSPGTNYPVHATSCWSSFRPGYIKPWT